MPQTTGKLHPLTRRALDKMWTLQQKGGAWNWAKCRWPPFEHDDYFGAVFAAVCVGSAPDDYAKSESAKEGLDRLQSYLQQYRLRPISIIKRGSCGPRSNSTA